MLERAYRVWIKFEVSILPLPHVTEKLYRMLLFVQKNYVLSCQLLKTDQQGKMLSFLSNIICKATYCELLVFQTNIISSLVRIGEELWQWRLCSLNSLKVFSKILNFSVSYWYMVNGHGILGSQYMVPSSCYAMLQCKHIYKDCGLKSRSLL